MIFIKKTVMSISKKEYHEKLQKFVDKVRELKEWKNTSDDPETIYYLQEEINNILFKMRELISERDKKN